MQCVGVGLLLRSGAGGLRLKERPRKCVFNQGSLHFRMRRKMAEQRSWGQNEALRPGSCAKGQELHCSSR